MVGLTVQQKMYHGLVQVDIKVGLGLRSDRCIPYSRFVHFKPNTAFEIFKLIYLWTHLHKFEICKLTFIFYDVQDFINVIWCFKIFRYLCRIRHLTLSIMSILSSGFKVYIQPFSSLSVYACLRVKEMVLVINIEMYRSPALSLCSFHFSSLVNQPVFYNFCWLVRFPFLAGIHSYIQWLVNSKYLLWTWNRQT